MSKKVEEKKKTKKEKKEMSDTTRVILFVLVIIVVISIIGVSCYFLLSDRSGNGNTEEPKKNIVSIDGYGITVDDLDSELYHKEYDILKENLTAKEIDFDKYAESVAKMFIIDLYTIDTKVNKYDVGGAEFVLEEARDNYITNVTDTMYKYVEDNSAGKRSQSLPEVSSVNITDTKKGKFKVKEMDKEFDSYTFKMEINYVRDLSYDKNAEVIVIKKDNKMYVVEKN